MGGSQTPGQLRRQLSTLTTAGLYKRLHTSEITVLFLLFTETQIAQGGWSLQSVCTGRQTSRSVSPARAALSSDEHAAWGRSSGNRRQRSTQVSEAEGQEGAGGSGVGVILPLMGVF